MCFKTKSFSQSLALCVPCIVVESQGFLSVSPSGGKPSLRVLIVAWFLRKLATMHASGELSILQSSLKTQLFPQMDVREERC